jgi:chitinase
MHRNQSFSLRVASFIGIGLLVIGLAVVISFRPTSARASSAALSSQWYNAAPYVMPLANTPPVLTTVMSATGAKAFTLAFVVANGGCTPAWETDSGLDNVSSDTQIAPIISAIRAAGGDVVVSFGGYNGNKLGAECGSAQATAAAEQAVVSKYSLKALDFDLEEPEYENSTAIANELGAAQILQANNAGLYESITLPGTTSGTGYFGQLLLSEAKTLGYTPNNYGIMPFDGGFSGASSQISALQSFNTLLVNTFGWSSANAYAHEGFSGMNGRTDSAEYFYQSDFQSVLSFAQTNALARFSYWSVNRDRECSPPDNNGSLSGTCSSVTQSDWDFTKIVVQFAGGTSSSPTPTATTVGSTPTPTATTGSTPTPTPTSSTTTSCTGISAWSTGVAYVSGDKITYNGELWQAKWWTENDTPGGAAGVWTLLGSC